MPGDPDADHALSAASCRDVVLRLSAAWQERRFDDISPLLHQHVVFAHPGFGGRTEGRQACAESYRQFMAAARVDAYAERDLTIDCWNDTAVATYRWEMTWTMDGKTRHETGRDLLVLAREEGRWLVSWRTILPASAR